MRARPSERALFFSLWTLLLIGVGIWHFWPKRFEWKQEKPKVQLSQELLGIFYGAVVTKESPSRYQVQLQLLPDYLQKIRKPQTIQIGFKLDRDSAPMRQGIAHCNIFPDREIATIELNNPELIVAKRIQLFLSH